MDKKRILLCLCRMGGSEMKYIEEAFADNWVVPLGPNVNGFEADLQRFLASGPDTSRLDKPMPETCYTGDEFRAYQVAHTLEDPAGKRIVALSAGTAAVHLALVACGVQPGDEVMVQSFTFSASANPVRYLGATPVFIDSEPLTWNMDPVLLDRAIGERTRLTGRKPKAIIAVYLYGMPGLIDELIAVARKWDIPLIEDAAEAFGSRYAGRCCGTFGRYGVLSFNGNKMITTSGGGALVCNDDADAGRIKFLATQARENYPYYQHEEIGYNYRMSNICAGIGRGQMEVLDEHIAHHRHVQALYRKLLAEVPGITLHDNPRPEIDSNFWLCAATLDEGTHIKGEEKAYSQATEGAVGGAAATTRAASSTHTAAEPDAAVEALRLALNAENIESRPLWKPMHLQPVFAASPRFGGAVCQRLFRRGICLPAGPWVTDEDVRRIVGCISDAIVR